MLPPRDIDSGHGVNQANGKHVSKCFGIFKRLQFILAPQAMAPPLSRAGLQTPSRPAPDFSSDHNDSRILPTSPTSVLTSEVQAEVSTSNGHRLGRIKNAGFKPIGQTSSAVKRFFPDDDDDVEAPQQTHAKPPTRSVDRPSLYQHRGEDPWSREDYKPRSRGQRDSPENGRHSNRRVPDPAVDDGAKTHHHRQGSPRLSPPHRTSHENISRLTDVGGDRQGSAQLTPTAHPQSLDRNDLAQPPSPPSGGSRGELYAIVSQVGEGTFGKVYKARNTITKVYVALKRIRMESERDGFPVTAMREIKLLQSLRHQNIVRLYEMMVSNGKHAASFRCPCSSVFT
jgi:hypothetical protein